MARQWIYFCDRCGGEIKDPFEQKSSGVIDKVSVRNFWFRKKKKEIEKDFDLCLECSEKFLKWMDNYEFEDCE